MKRDSKLLQQNQSLRELVKAKNVILKHAIHQLNGVLRINADAIEPDGKIKVIQDPLGNVAFFIVAEDANGLPILGDAFSTPILRN